MCIYNSKTGRWRQADAWSSQISQLDWIHAPGSKIGIETDLRGGSLGKKHPYKPKDLKSVFRPHHRKRIRQWLRKTFNTNLLPLHIHVYTCAHKHMHMHITQNANNNISLCLNYSNFVLYSINSANCYKNEVKVHHGGSFLWLKHSETQDKKDPVSSMPTWATC